MSEFAPNRTLARLAFWVRRYLPAELLGTASLLIAAGATAAATDSAPLITLAALIGETVGFYGVLIVTVYREQRMHHPLAARPSRRRMLARTLLLVVAEFGPAELIDTLLLRPLLLVVGLLLSDNSMFGLIAGKIAADVVFYAMAAMAYTATKRLNLRTRRPDATAAPSPDPTLPTLPSVPSVPNTPTTPTTPTAAVRTSTGHLSIPAAPDRAHLRALLAHPTTRRAQSDYGTPLLLLEPEVVRTQYRHLTRALPFVRWHYAVKALSHPDVLTMIASENGCFDVASDAELDLVRSLGVDPSRILNTHPIKTADEIARAVGAGIRLFVVDNRRELAKFEGLPADVRVLVRLAYRNAASKSDLSSKFGVGPVEARGLVEAAIAQGTRVAGFSFHVGSQLDAPARFGSAVIQTLALMDALEQSLPVRFDTLDIGGGFPVAYDQKVAGIDEIAAVLRPLLEPRASELDIIAEPGRILVAEAVTLVTSVVGVSERSDGRWYYLDDGVYGSYSNVVAEDVHPLLVAEFELDESSASSLVEARPRRRATVAGPTCDSADVIARGAVLPVLDVGDLIVSPAMGAYTAVTACRFNGRTPTPIVTVFVPDEEGGLRRVQLHDTQPIRLVATP